MPVSSLALCSVMSPLNISRGKSKLRRSTLEKNWSEPVSQDREQCYSRFLHHEEVSWVYSFIHPSFFYFNVKGSGSAQAPDGVKQSSLLVFEAQHLNQNSYDLVYGRLVWQRVQLSTAQQESFRTEWTVGHFGPCTKYCTCLNTPGQYTGILVQKIMGRKWDPKN